MSNNRMPLHLFAGYGVELEYMIVRQDTLQVAPIADQLIYDEVGAYVADVEFGEIAWSNELVLHVVELKTQGPVETLEGLHLKFQEHVRKINQMLQQHQACLLPTGAHPLMNPYTDTKLWPHEHNAVYEAYNRIFDCRGHGWANLQSTHLNLPFHDDAEFEKLHAAIRLVLPLLPALSASSPMLDGKISGFLDTRLEVYRHNQDKIPRIAGKIIPEAVFSKADYEKQILQPIYEDIAASDPDGVLQDEFLNSRGAIARFQRNTIEIRLLDIQECPLADVAVLQAAVAVIKALVAERWVKTDAVKEWDEQWLAGLFLEVVKNGRHAIIRGNEYLRCFGLGELEHCTVNTLWRHLINSTLHAAAQQEVKDVLEIILTQGSLSERILEVFGNKPDEMRVRQVYRKLANCLQDGTIFNPAKYGKTFTDL